MNKLTAIAIAVAGASLAAAAICSAKAHANRNDQLTKNLNDLRDDLELDCDLINSAHEESPEETITTDDRKYKEVVDRAQDFATSVFNIYAYLDSEEIDKLTADAKRAYVECFSVIIKNAEKHIYAIDDARAQMIQARRAMGIKLDNE